MRPAPAGVGDQVDMGPARSCLLMHTHRQSRLRMDELTTPEPIVLPIDATVDAIL